MESVRIRVDVRPITNIKDYQKLWNMRRFPFQKIFIKNLLAVHKSNEVLALDKTAYVGRC